SADASSSNSSQCTYRVRRRRKSSVVVIDKLEVRVSSAAEFTKEFESLFLSAALHQSRHYKIVTDLRAYGYDSILHYCCRYGKEHNHKLELVDTAAMTLADMAQEIESVFRVDTDELAIMRLDLAVDIQGIGVPWF